MKTRIFLVSIIGIESDNAGEIQNAIFDALENEILFNRKSPLYDCDIQVTQFI